MDKKSNSIFIKIDTDNLSNIVRQVPVEKRPSKAAYYLSIANNIAQRATCLRRKYGAIIVKNDRIVSTGYNGAPRCRKNCCDIGTCLRQKYNIPSGERYELCRSVHAEMNAIIQASAEEMEGATLFLSGIDSETGEKLSKTECCSMCKRAIINAGICKVIYDGDNSEECYVQEWINDDESLELHGGY
jgi:dCMP deaminase